MIDFPDQCLLARKARSRRLVLAAVGLLFFGLVIFGAHVWKESHNAAEVSKPFDRERIRANLIAQIRRRALDEIFKLDGTRLLERIAELEKTRDQQLADVDRFLEQMAGAFEEKEASADYITASRLLAGPGGAAKALRFLESKSRAPEAKVVLGRVEKMEQPAPRELLREQLLAASLRVKNAQWHKAEAVDQWAKTQNNLAIALLSLAERTEGAESRRLLGEAVTAFRSALEVSTREQDPEDWAMTQFNLGNALSYQGVWTSGAGSLRLLGEAVTAFRAALTVYTREQSPQDWASTQYNLANALMNQGQGRGVPEREGDASDAENMRLDAEAVTAYRAALEIYTREQVPQDWARAQYNLGGALSNQSMHAEGAEMKRLLGEALTAYRASLEIYTRKEFPQEWASTQFSIAFTLRALADRSEAAEAQRLRAEAEAIDKELATP